MDFKIDILKPPKLETKTKPKTAYPNVKESIR